MAASPARQPDIRRSHRLRSTLSLALLALTAFFLVVNDGLGLLFTYRLEQSNTVNQLELTARQAADAIYKMVESKVEILAVTAIDYAVASPEESEYLAGLGRLVGRENSFNQVLLWDLQGQEIARVCRRAVADCRRTVTGPDARALEAAKAKRPYYGPVDFDPISGEPMMLVAVPMLNVYQEPTQVLAAEVRLKFMWETISSIRPGIDGSLYVTDDLGRLIVFDDASRVLKRESLVGLREVAAYLRGDNDIRAIGVSPTPGIRGDRVISSHVALANPRWAVVVEIPITEANASLITAVKQLAALMLFSVVFAALVGWYIAWRIAKPVLELRDAAEKMSEGDLSVRISELYRSEIGDLARSFNTMAEKLSASYGALEAKVEERTKELAQKKVAAERERERVETVLRSIGDGVFVVDAAGRLAMVNRTAENMVGLPVGSAVGRPYAETFVFRQEKDGTDVGQFVAQAIGTGSVARPEGEVLLIARDGKALPVTVSAASLVSGGEVFGAVAVIRDETREREISRMKSDFVSLASHQLRAPLTAIKWSLENLAGDDESGLSKDQRESYDIAHQSIERLVRLINDLLNVSRIESGHIALLPKPTDVDALCGDVIKEAAPNAATKGLALVNEVRGLGTANLDSKLMFQVLANLVSNAIKYTGTSGRIVVGGRRGVNDVEIYVKDNGMGIPESAQGKMFQKFYRAENVTKTEIEGTGLGLYLVKAIVESSGGRIWYESELGKGTTFWVSLPIAGVVARTGDKQLIT